MKKLDFLILVEHVSRELDSAQVLALELQKKGMNGAIFPLHYLRNLRVVISQPKIIIAPFFYSSENKHHINFKDLYTDVEALDLHAEQICDETTKNMRMPQDNYAKSINHISWSDNFASYLIDCGVERENILVSGCNRCDSFSSDIDSDSNDILICTSFSRTFVSDSYIEQMLSKLSFNKELYLKKITFTKKVRDAYFKDIYDYAIKTPNKNVIIRPHPYVSLADFSSKFLEINNIAKMPKNISVLREGSIQSAIDKSKLVIAWQSSVILDARLAGKNCLMLEPYSTPEYMKISFSDVVPKIESLNLLEDIEHDYSNLDRYIKEIYGVVDGKASARIAAWIDALLTNKKFNQKLSFASLPKIFIKAFTSDLAILVLRKIGLLTKFFPLYKGLEEDYFKPIYFTKNDS